MTKINAMRCCECANDTFRVELRGDGVFVECTGCGAVTQGRIEPAFLVQSVPRGSSRGHLRPAYDEEISPTKEVEELDF